MCRSLHTKAVKEPKIEEHFENMNILYTFLQMNKGESEVRIARGEITRNKTKQKKKENNTNPEGFISSIVVITKHSKVQ